MSEQPADPARPGQEEAAQTSAGRDVARAGGGRTEGETSVDEAEGSADDPRS
jgi:hypothetical protein